MRDRIIVFSRFEDEDQQERDSTNGGEYRKSAEYTFVNLYRVIRLPSNGRSTGSSYIMMYLYSPAKLPRNSTPVHRCPSCKAHVEWKWLYSKSLADRDTNPTLEPLISPVNPLVAAQDPTLTAPHHNLLPRKAPRCRHHRFSSSPPHPHKSSSSSTPSVF